MNRHTKYVLVLLDVYSDCSSSFRSRITWPSLNHCIMKTEFISSFATAPYCVHGQTNQWNDMRLQHYCNTMAIAYLHVLRREVRGEWPSTWYHEPSDIDGMRSALMRHLVKARNDGLSMELIIDDMSTDVVRIGHFGAELWSHIQLTYVQTFPWSDGADLCRHQPETPPLPCHHAGPCAVITWCGWYRIR